MILTRKTAEDKNEDDPDDNQEEAALGEITWDWGCTPVPTVDLLYPDESPEDNARWYWELHQSRPRTTPRKAISNTKYKFESNISTEDEMYCNLCFHEGQPVSVVRSHPNLDITCPTMTDQEKETVYGPNWLPKMYGYPDQQEDEKEKATLILLQNQFAAWPLYCLYLRFVIRINNLT